MAEIYALVDPRDGRVRYVGMSTAPYGRFDRLGWHLRDAALQRVLSPKVLWIRELFATGRVPEVMLLEKCEDGLALVKEREWIALYAMPGQELTNQVHNGYRPTDEQRAKMSELMRGREIPQHTRDAVAKANSERTWTEDQRIQLSQTLRGHEVSDDTRERMSAARTNHWADIAPAERSARAARGWKTRRQRAKS